MGVGEDVGVHLFKLAEQLARRGQLQRETLVHLVELVLDAADVFSRLLLFGVQLFLAALFRQGRQAFLHLLAGRELFLHHVPGRLDGLHLLAQARSLQHAALINGFEHDRVGLVRPAQREQALRRLLHAGETLVQGIGDRLQPLGEAVDLDFHGVQLVLILLERLFPHGVVRGRGFALLLGRFGFRAQLGRRGFGFLPRPFLGFRLGLGFLFRLGFGLGFGFRLFLGLLLRLGFGFLFGLFLVGKGLFGGCVRLLVGGFRLVDGLFRGRRCVFLGVRGGEKRPRGQAPQQARHDDQGDGLVGMFCEKTLQLHGMCIPSINRSLSRKHMPNGLELQPVRGVVLPRNLARPLRRVPSREPETVPIRLRSTRASADRA